MATRRDQDLESHPNDLQRMRPLVRERDITITGVTQHTDAVLVSAGISILGWAQDLSFSASDNDTVAWGSGTITLQDGASFSISAGNTGNMSATTYIFLDTAVSTTVLQITTTASSAVGANRILVAVARNSTSGTNATFLTFGGASGTVVSQTVNLTNEISGTLTAAFAEAGLINSNVTISADGSLSGAGGGQVTLNDITGALDLSTKVSGTLSTSFAAAGLINSGVTINANGTLSGAGAGQASLTNLPGAVQVGSIAANAVTATQIAALTITAAEIAATTITAAKIAAGTITATQIAALTITAAEIAALTITAAKIAANTITATQIAADTITAAEIAAGTITVNEMAANSITATEINVASLSAIVSNMGIITAGRIQVGNIEINADTERILFGAATAPLVGVGIFMGLDGADYELRVGDPAGQFLHWDGSELLYTGKSKALHKDFTVRSHTGSTGEAELETVTIPAGSMGATGGLRVHLWGTGAGTAGQKNCRVRLGGTQIAVHGQFDTSRWDMLVEIHNTTASAQVSRAIHQNIPVTGTPLVGMSNSTTSVNTDSADRELGIFAQNGNAGDTLTLLGSTVEYIQ